MSAVLTLDDTDPSIVYSTGWGRAGSKLEYNSTTSYTSTAGTTATVTFTGTSIGVFGTISARQIRLTPPISTYSIDGGTPVTFTADPTLRTQYSQQFFQSPTLPEGVHKLVITHTEASATFFLDFMRVGVDTAQSSSSSSSSASSSSTSVSQTSSSTSLSSSSTTSSSTLPLTSPSTTTTPPPQSTVTETVPGTSSTSALDAAASAGASETGATKSSSNAGAIAGGIIGGIAVLALLAFIVMWWWRRRQQRKWQNEFLDSTPNWAPTIGATTASSSDHYGQSSAVQSQSMNQAEPMRTYPFAASQTRYQGGYAPSPSPAIGSGGGMYNQNPGYGGPAPQQYGGSYEGAYGGYEGAGTGGYNGGNAYIPPSQLLQAQNNNGYGSGTRPY